jgi:hypothetical protein
MADEEIAVDGILDGKAPDWGAFTAPNRTRENDPAVYTEGEDDDEKQLAPEDDGTTDATEEDVDVEVEEELNPEDDPRFKGKSREEVIKLQHKTQQEYTRARQEAAELKARIAELESGAVTVPPVITPVVPPAPQVTPAEQRQQFANQEYHKLKAQGLVEYNDEEDPDDLSPAAKLAWQLADDRMAQQAEIDAIRHQVAPIIAQSVTASVTPQIATMMKGLPNFGVTAQQVMARMVSQIAPSAIATFPALWDAASESDREAFVMQVARDVQRTSAATPAVQKPVTAPAQPVPASGGTGVSVNPAGKTVRKVTLTRGQLAEVDAYIQNFGGTRNEAIAAVKGA